MLIMSSNIFSIPTPHPPPTPQCIKEIPSHLVLEHVVVFFFLLRDYISFTFWFVLEEEKKTQDRMQYKNRAFMKINIFWLFYNSIELR